MIEDIKHQEDGPKRMSSFFFFKERLRHKTEAKDDCMMTVAFRSQNIHSFEMLPL